MGKTSKSRETTKKTKKQNKGTKTKQNRKKKIWKRILIAMIVLIIVLAGIFAGLIVGISTKYAITKEDLIIELSNSIVVDEDGKTISIEAKIKDWKSGILQAQRYLMFSDFSYLALPEEKIKNKI